MPAAIRIAGAGRSFSVIISGLQFKIMHEEKSFSFFPGFQILV
jgi:hypothetical protein